MKNFIPVLLSCFAVSSLSLRAAEKKEEKAVASHMLSEYNLGKTVSNDEATQESVKNKVVVLEMWGIH